MRMVTDFQENIDEEKLHTFEQKRSRWQNEIGVTDQAIIDSLLDDLGNIFTCSAKKTFGTFNCKTARNAFFKKVSSIWKAYGTGIPILGD